MVNYVLSFCKITGASKIFKRNFYLPLLKPATPKDALRTLRITGKWLLGAKVQHYIPVLLHHSEKRSDSSDDFGKQPHCKSGDYTYMTPNLDPENDSHKIILKILESKKRRGSFAYTVEDKKYNIVFDSDFEDAIRNGDILDVLVSQKNDKIIVKLKDRKKIPVEIQYFEGDQDDLYCGEGATSPEEEKFHHHGKYTMSLAKIFEEKEMREEKWEEELKKIMKRRKKQKWENSKAYKEMMKRNMKNLNWNKFEEEAKKLIDDLEEPGTEKPIEMEVDDLDATKNVNETILRRGPELLNQLPTLTEIPDLIKNMGSASLHEIEDIPNEQNESTRKVSGIKVTLPSGKECFVSGQMVLTEEGEVFVPGQTVQGEYGDEYVPGITTNVGNQPTLVGGLIMGEEQRDPMFLPSQSAITSDGQLTFATVPEERPVPLPESERKLERKKKIKEEIPLENLYDNFQVILIDDDFSEDLSESEEKSMDESSIELNNSEIEELDMEAIRLKQEEHRAQMEKLQQHLFDDLTDIISNLEDKKAELNRKLDELRKQHMVNQNNLVTYVNEKDALEIAKRISTDKDSINRLVDILLTMTRRSSTFRDKNNVRTDNIDASYLNDNANDFELALHSCSNKLKVLFKTALVAANDVFKNRPKDQLLALHTMGKILTEPLKNDIKLLLELTNLMKTQMDRDEICNTALKILSRVVEDTKVATLNSILENPMSVQDVLENIEKILGNDNVMHISFSKLAKLNSEIVKSMIENIKDQRSELTSEEAAVRVLQSSIVHATKILMNKNLEKWKNSNSYSELIEEAASFAKALSLKDLIEDFSKPINEHVFEESIEMIRRMTIIRQLAERDYSLKTAITRIKKNPECAKSDPRIRQLIRESAVLISNPAPLLTSRTIPLQLMKKQNLLAIEDFLVKRTTVDYPVLISRGSMQAVIPMDASRGVLAGRVPYVLIDESGVTNFKPMHMKAAIQVNKTREKMIDDYLGVAREKSAEKEESSAYLKAKSNVRKLKKMFNHRNCA